VSRVDAHAVALAVLEIAERAPGSPLVAFAMASKPVAKELRRLEAQRLEALLADAGVSEGERSRLAAARVNRSPRTIRRWRRAAVHP
jgi:hypothetical protein